MDTKLLHLLAWVIKLTRTPAQMRESDIEMLRAVGWTDPEISNAAFVCSYFNFINRVADGMGVDLEDWMHDRPPLGPCPW